MRRIEFCAFIGPLYSTSYIVSNRKRRLYSTHYTGWNILPDSHRVCRFTFMWWQIDRGKRIKRRRVVVGALFFLCARRNTNSTLWYDTCTLRLERVSDYSILLHRDIHIKHRNVYVYAYIIYILLHYDVCLFRSFHLNFVRLRVYQTRTIFTYRYEIIIIIIFCNAASRSRVSALSKKLTTLIKSLQKEIVADELRCNARLPRVKSKQIVLVL